MNPHHSNKNDDHDPNEREHDERRAGEPENQEQDQGDGAELDEFLTLAEVARLLRVPPATVRYWRHQHTGPRSFRIGRHVRYRQSDVLHWIARQINNGSGDAA